MYYGAIPHSLHSPIPTDLLQDSQSVQQALGLTWPVLHLPNQGISHLHHYATIVIHIYV